jgi:hypothetical protein
VSVYRLTGKLEEVATRDGISKATKEPYSIPYLNVRVDRFVVTSANVPDGLYDKLRSLVGQPIDLVVDVTASGGYLRSQVLDLWPDDVQASKHLAAVAAK